MASSVQIPVTQTGLEASIQAALKNAGKNATINLGANARQINALSQPLGRITGQADEFTKSMEAANARVFAFGASVGIINTVSNAFGALVKNTIAVEKSLVEINTVLGTSSSELDKFGGKLFEVAKNTGQSFEAVSKGALELARQGLGTEETLRRINDALILTRLSGLDAGKSVEGLTSAVNSFKSTGITTSEVLNKLVNVSQKYAVSEKDLIEGLKRSSSVAKQAGVSFDELVGVITAVQEKSAVGGAVIGTSFKTIFSRLQKRDTLDALQQLGVEVTDVQGKILPATRLLENLAVKIKSLDQIQIAQITEKVGGGYQIDKLISALDDMGSKGSVAFEATKISAESANQAYAKNAALNKTLANLINETTLSAQELGATLGKLGITDSAKNLLGFFNSLLESIQKVLGEESAIGDVFRGLAKGIGNLITGPGLALFGAIILKLSKDLAQFGFSSLKSFFGIGKAAKEIETVEKSVANALSTNIGLQRQLFALEGNRAAQIKVMTDAIVQQEAAMRRMASTSSSLAGPLYQQGVRGTNTGLRVPKAAGGYMPAVAKESSDINRGVGGARSGDRPVVIPNFNFGGGQRGSMVAHTGEYAVPNFAGSGGTAIFNRDMVRSMGLPSGAKKIGAAGGLIPNFADVNIKRSLIDYPNLKNINKADSIDSFSAKISPIYQSLTSSEYSVDVNRKLNSIVPKFGKSTGLEVNVSELDRTLALFKKEGVDPSSIKSFESSIRNLNLASPTKGQYSNLHNKLKGIMGEIDAARLTKQKLNTGNSFFDLTGGIEVKTVKSQKSSEILKKGINQFLANKNIKDNKDNRSQLGKISVVLPKGTPLLNSASGFIPNFAFNADTVRQYASDIEKYRQGLKYVFPDGTSGYESQIQKVLSRPVAKATINKQAAVTKRQEDMQKKGAMDFFIDANSLGGIALVTPSRRGSSGTLSAESKMLNLPHKPDGVLMDDRLVIKNIQSTGVPAQKNFEQISSEINKLFAGPIVSLAQSLYGKLYSGASGSEFASQLGQLKSTSKGGILPPGAEGQIFEAAGKAALTSMNQIASAFDPRKENRPFDFTNATSMKEMLGVKAVRGDAKRAGGSEKQFKETVNGLVKKSINDPQLKSGIFSQIKQQSRGRVLPENASGGYVPNFVSQSRRIGSGAEASFLRLGSKGGMDVGVKKFYKDGPKNALSQEWLISQFINRYLNIPGIYGPKTLSGFNESNRRGGIRKEIISGKLGKVALGSEKGRYFGLGTMRSAVKTKGLDLPDLHGANYIVNSNAEKYLDKMSNYPTDAVGSLSLLRDMASKGGVASIIDPGFARLTGSPARDVVDKMLNYLDSKKKTAAGGFVPNFAIDLTKSEDHTKNQRKRSSKARTYRTASGVIGSLFKSLPDKFFSDGILGDAAQGLETGGILDLIKNNSLYAASFAGPKAVKFVLEAEKYGLKVTKGLQKKLASLTTKAVGKFKGFSSGFLPNFADPLKEAVGREMAAGVPASQIYIDKNQSLKSAANPMGLMVANRRDEPAGGHQGISRAIKEGRNPKTYGAASGFVPNYADAPDISGYAGKTRSVALAEESKNYGKAYADLITELRKATADEKKARGKNKKAAQDRIKALEDDREALKKSSEATRKAIIEQSKGLRGNGKTLTGKEATVQAKGGQKDMLGTIFAVQGAMSLLTGATEGSSSALGKFTNSLSSSLGNLATAGFAFQGLKQMVPEGNKFAGTLGKLGTAGMIAIAGFEAFKLGIDLYKIFSKDASEQVKKTEQAMAKFSDSVNQAGVSIEGLSKEARMSSMKSAEGSLYNLGAGIDLFDDIFGRAYKDPKMQEMYANAQYISGMSEEEIAQKFIERGATTASYDEYSARTLDTDNSKAVQVLSEIAAMPQKGTDEYEKRIKRIIQLRKEQQKIQKDIEAPFEKEAIMNRANLDLLEQQLSNRIAYKEALFQQSSAEEISLEMQKEMLSFSEKDRMLADEKLSSLQSAKKLTLDQSKASFDILKNSELLKSRVTEDVLGDVSAETFQEIAGISEKVADSIREQGGYTEVVRKKAEELLSGISLEEKQRRNILNVLEETNKALTDQVRLEEKSNALNKFKTSIIEAQNFALEKQKEAAVYTFERNSKSNDVAKRRKDIELETFKIDAERRKIGASSAQSVSIDKEIIKKEIESVNFKLNLDKKDLIIQLRKTLTEAALSSGMGIDQIKQLNLGAKNTNQQFQEAANQIAEAEKKAKIEKINAAFEELKLQSQASDYFQDAVKKSADYIKESVQSIFGFIGIKPKEESVVYGPELPNRSEFLDAQKQRAVDAVNQTTGILGDAVNASFEEMELKTREATNTIGQFNNSLLSAGASLITFAKLVSDVFLNLQDEITQNKFSYLTATDPQSMISAALQDTKLSTLKSGPATEDTIVAAADKVALLEKELEIKRATTTEAKIGAELELQKLKEILPLRLELLKAETDEERIRIIDKIIAKEKERLPLAKRLESIFTSSPEEQKNRLEDTIVQASEQFKSNMIDGISEAIEGGKSLGDVLQNSAYEFVKAINKQLMSNLVDSVVGSGKQAASGGSGFLSSIMSSIGFASGGKVNGGSGMKDDVPAMLMGGEYVINKKAVQKYGPQFLEALNNGTIGGYAKGGKVQSGKGGFFTPGTYGLGGIEGTRNLLQFATQGYTSGARDMITNTAGYQSIALEPESARLTNLGRSNSPQAQATRAAKEQAFGLYAQEINAQMEAAKQAEAEKDAFKKQLIMTGIMAAGSYLGGVAKTGFQQGIATAGKDATALQKFTSGISGVGEKFGNVGSGITSLFSGNGKAASEYFSMANTNFTDVKKGSEVEEFVKQVSSGGYKSSAINSGYGFDSSSSIGLPPVDLPIGDFSMGETPLSPLAQKELMNRNLAFQLAREKFEQDPRFYGSTFLLDKLASDQVKKLSETSSINSYILGQGGKPYATGGSISSRGGIDTVPAMLSGGEFIMNRSAAQNIGAGNLQALNAGAGSIVTEEKTEELNDKLIAKLDELIEASGGGGSITINVEGSAGTANQTTSGQTSEQKQQLARQIKDAVVKVIQEEKRLGGSLRR